MTTASSSKLAATRFIQNGDRLRRTAGGGSISFFGLIFLLFPLLIVITILSHSATVHSPIGVAIFLVVFTPVGLIFVFGRYIVEIDRSASTFTRRVTFLGIPLFPKTRQLPREAAVLITREVRSSKDSTYTVYPVRLTVDAPKPLNLGEWQDYLKSRAVAETVAKFLHCSVTDASGPATTTRTADELDQSLREHARHTPDHTQVPDLPPNSRLRFHAEGDDAVIDLPPQRNYASFVLVIPFILIAALVPNPYFIPAELLPVLGFLAIFHSQSTIRVSPQRLLVRSSGWLRSRTDEIPADRIEELLLPSDIVSASQWMPESGLIQARSDDKVLTLGSGLTSTEARWVHAVLMKVLTK